MFGYSKDESGTEISSWTERLHPDDLQPIDASIHKSIENGEQSWAGEYRFRRRDGSYAFITDRGHIVYDENGKPSRMIGSMMDITERKRAEEELKDFAARLERSNNELQEFASIASHDLQEPLRKVQAFGDRLKIKCGDSLNEDGRDYLERMQNAAGRMQTLINDLLTFSRVSTQAQPFLPVNLRQVADEVLSDLEMRIETTGGTIEIGELATIDADPTQMRQLLQNLISNALKFNRPGVPPIVKISGQICHKTAENEEPSAVATYCLTVEDNGIGFEEKYNERIFKVFQRLHGRNEYEGTGIGLAVCRKIAELHGGDITTRSIPNEGTIFTVNLPLVQREKAHNE
jgi:PAS domain S-box-containing protein